MSASGIPREVVLGVGAGVAAYKAADLLRRLQDHGYLVTVIPTVNSLNFVGKATWEALSGRPVTTELWNNVHEVPHIATAKRAKAIVIAPATADLIARIASGRADDYLTNVVLASTAPLLLVPAMHPQMWLNSATVANVALLRSRGVIVLNPETGRLTGSDSGIGRFPESGIIIENLNAILERAADLQGIRILVTAGGTREPIDPVRYIGNRSSGKQGYAIAEAAAARGAIVTVVAANVDLPHIAGVETYNVQTALEMHDLLLSLSQKVDVIVMTAAVADFRPTVNSLGKIPKSDLTEIALTENPDILKALASQRSAQQLLVGFAAETEGDIVARGTSKLLAKGVDLLFVNDVSHGAIFGEAKTSGWILSTGSEPVHFNSVTKLDLANALLNRVVDKLGQ